MCGAAVVLTAGDGCFAAVNVVADKTVALDISIPIPITAAVVIVVFGDVVNQVVNVVFLIVERCTHSAHFVIV